ncbi:MAG: hypothetical protein ABFD50_05760 [Smithella sp.]
MNRFANEMNLAIAEALEHFNEAPFQKKDGSRNSVFQEEELPFLQALPQFAYQYAEWKKATVQMNYHIALDHQNYSVPHSYVRKKVDVRYTNELVEAFYEGRRIACHKRIHGRHGQYATIVEHIPLNHQLYSEWDGKRFRSWARKIGPSTYETVEKQLTSYCVEEQAYKGCLALLKLSEKFGTARLENACFMALQCVPVPRYKLINSILATGQDKKSSKANKPKAPSSSSHAFVRGAAYYGGDHHDE